MAAGEHASLTKEFPLSTSDATIAAITPNMSYSDLREFARRNTNAAAPGLLKKRLLLVQKDGTIAYDRYLSLVRTEGSDSALVRKVMFFTWAYRDDRLRRFICEVVANERGKWRISELEKKSNASFFERFLQEGPATKARSNVEYFLVEAGIFDKGRRQINLELDDGWLTEAAAVAAQHETDRFERRRLLSDPATFLIEKGWNGLVNATVEELRSGAVATSSDATPVEDEAVRTGPNRISPSREWNRPRPKTSDKTSTSVRVDLVKMERANRSHHLLEQILAEKARDCGYQPMSNENIDIFFRTPAGSILAEIKSCVSKNIHGQIRKGISQLFEYKYLYSNDLGETPILTLLLETSLPAEKAWMLDYLKSLEISLVWKHPDQRELVSTEPIPEALRGIVHALGAN